MAQARRLSGDQAGMIQTLTDAGVPRDDIARTFDLSNPGVALYLSREGHTRPPRQVARLENAWKAVTDPARNDFGYPREAQIARMVVDYVFRPLVNRTLEDTKLIPHLDEAINPSSPDGFAYRLLGKQTSSFPRNIAAWSMEESREPGDTPRTLVERASKRIFGMVPRGHFVMSQQQEEVLDHVLADIFDNKLSERESNITRMVLGYGTDVTPIEDVAEWFGLPKERAARIAQKGVIKAGYGLKRNPEWKAAGPLPIDAFKPTYLV